jgi:pyruvate/2-oxoglutarate dehydrogenase complex dihydrolipoamide acyltransferase (E2) component
MIDQPRVPISAHGTIQRRPAVRENAIAIRPRVHRSLPYDHLLINVEMESQFLGRLKNLLEGWNESVL